MKTISLSMDDETYQHSIKYDANLPVSDNNYLSRSKLHRHKQSDIVPVIRSGYHFQQLLCRRTAHTVQSRNHSKSEHLQMYPLYPSLWIDNNGSLLGIEKHKQSKLAAG